MDSRSHPTGPGPSRLDPTAGAQATAGPAPRTPLREEERWRCLAVELVSRCQCGDRRAGRELLARHGEPLARFHALQRAIALHGSRRSVDGYWRLFVLQDRRPYTGRTGLHALLARTALVLRMREAGAPLALGLGALPGNGPEGWLAELAEGAGLVSGWKPAEGDERRRILDATLVQLPAHPRQALLYGSILCAPAPAAAHWIGFQRVADYLDVLAKARMTWLRSAEALLRAEARDADPGAHPPTASPALG